MTPGWAGFLETLPLGIAFEIYTWLDAFQAPNQQCQSTVIKHYQNVLTYLQRPASCEQYQLTKYRVTEKRPLHSTAYSVCMVAVVES